MKSVNLVLALFIMASVFDATRAPAADAPAAAKPDPNRELARQLNQAFVDVASEVSPAVVVIDVKGAPPAQFSSDQSPDDGGDPADEFRRFFRGLPPSTQPSEGQGSGVIIRKEGYILTNRHVVENANNITVRLKDGRVFTNVVVRGVDAPSDVAVIKINADNLPVARLADSSKTRVGEFAIAIGAPFALDYSVTFGHVSAKDRSNIIDEPGRGMTDQDFIQTDANINPGNSGGPLVNIDGEVIGINTLIRGIRTGIGFAIPSNLAREVADEIIANGKFTRSWLGIGIRSLPESDERELFHDLAEGVVVEGIITNGPAAKSDLKEVDVITAVDSTPVTTEQQLKAEIRKKKVGQSVVLEVFRLGDDGKGRKLNVSVKPGEWQESAPAITSNPTDRIPSPVFGGPFGLQVSNLTREQAARKHVEMSAGVLVTGVIGRGLAARAGIVSGDVLTAVDSHAITSVREFQEAEKSADLRKGVVLGLVREGKPRIELLRQPSY